MPDLPTGLTQDEMRKKIWHERRVELAFEDFRFFDIRRWRIAEEVENLGTTPRLGTFPDSLTKLPAICLHMFSNFANIAENMLTDTSVWPSIAKGGDWSLANFWLLSLGKSETGSLYFDL